MNHPSSSWGCQPPGGANFENSSSSPKAPRPARPPPPGPPAASPAVSATAAAAAAPSERDPAPLLPRQRRLDQPLQLLVVPRRPHVLAVQEQRRRVLHPRRQTRLL